VILNQTDSPQVLVRAVQISCFLAFPSSDLATSHFPENSLTSLLHSLLSAVTPGIYVQCNLDNPN
jgi:hypothetical protein